MTLHLLDSSPTEDTSPTGHFPDWTLHRLDSSPTGHFTDWTLHLLDTSPTGHFTDWTLHRLDISPTGHFTNQGHFADQKIAPFDLKCRMEQFFGQRSVL